MREFKYLRKVKRINTGVYKFTYGRTDKKERLEENKFVEGRRREREWS